MNRVFLYLLLIVSVHMSGQTWECGDYLIDERDGQQYKTVQIGNICWMAENLNIGTRLDSTVFPANNDIIEKHCYRDDSSNCDVYGGLYHWDEMLNYNFNNKVGICPEGWRVSGNEHFEYIVDLLGRWSPAGGMLKDTSELWLSPNVGATNESGFSALPGGYVWELSQGYFDLHTNAYFWAPFSTNSVSRYVYLRNDLNSIVWAMTPIQEAVSLRCIKPINQAIDEKGYQYEMKINTNPFKNKAVISINFNSGEISDMQLFDQYGRSANFEFSLSQKEIVIYRGNLQAGLYILHVKTLDNQFTKLKLVAL